MDKKDIMIEGLLNRIKRLEFENAVMFAELTELQMKQKEVDTGGDNAE